MPKLYYRLSSLHPIALVYAMTPLLIDPIFSRH